MKSSSCIRGSLSLCNIMHLHVKGRFPVKWLANLILFTQPSVESATAGKWVDSWERLQFRFFLNLFSCLLITNLSRRNNTSEGTATESESPLQSTFIHAISLPPEMFTRPPQDANDSLFVLRPWCNAIRVRTPPGMAWIDGYQGYRDLTPPPPPNVGNKSTTSFMQLNTFLL